MSAQPRLVADRFKLVRRLGAGAMASVFLAEDVELGRMVAIKRLHPGTPADIAPRLRREMRVAASLSHPNVVTLFDAIETDESVLLIMEYVDGPTLAQRMADGPLGSAEAMAILRPLADAVDYLHDRGVIHRDIKPANILLDRGGRVKLTDLGIASAAQATAITTSGSVLGTPAYMAPELFEGEPATPAADIYSIAAIAYEILTGRRVREGGPAAAIALRAASAPPPDLREHWPQARRLADALARGMALRPADRPGSAAALVAEIADGLEDLGRAPARPAARPARSGRPARAAVPAAAARGRGATGQGRVPRAPAVLLAVGLALAAVVAAVLLLGSGGSEPARRPAASVGSTARTTASTRKRRPATTAAPAQGTTTPRTQTTAPPATSAARTSPSRTATSTAQAPTTTATPAPATPAPAPQGSAAAPDTPTGAVEAFYGRAAAHRYADAWELAAPGLRSQLGGFAAFRSQFSSVRSITFGRASTVRQSAAGATVAIATTATHTDHVDHCTGTVDTVPASGGGWLVTHVSVSC